MFHDFIEMLVEGSDCLKDIVYLIIHVLPEGSGEVSKLIFEFGANGGDFLANHLGEVVLHVSHNLFPEFFCINRWMSSGLGVGFGWFGLLLCRCFLLLLGFLW